MDRRDRQTSSIDRLFQADPREFGFAFQFSSFGFQIFRACKGAGGIPVGFCRYTFLFILF
jgi:hypothetical protein